MLAAALTLPSLAHAGANDVRVRFTGAMEQFFQPNEQPSNDEIVNIRREAWDLIWTGTKSELGASGLAQPRVLLATGQALSTFTNRAPCHAELRFISNLAPFIAVIRREGNLDVASVDTPWETPYIDSSPAPLQCFDARNGFVGQTLASRATWLPAQPLNNPGETLELQGVEHLKTALLRFNPDVPDTTIPFSFSYTYPAGTGGDPGMHKIVWFGRVSIESDPQGTPSPQNLSGLLPGSTGFGAPGSPPPPTGLGAVTGDHLLQVIDVAASDFLRAVTGFSVDAAAAGGRTVTVTLLPPESWSESGRLTMRLCTAAKRNSATTCRASRALASASLGVRGTSFAGAGAGAGTSARPQTITFHTTAATVRRIRAARVVRIDASFAGAVTHRTVTAHRILVRR